MSEVKELIAVPVKETALAVFTAKEGLEPWLQQIRAEVDKFNQTLPDLKTNKGRELYASMAYKIAKSKNALDALGKQISAEQKEVPKKIDAERKRVWDKLELWQKEVRKPLDDWQAAEDKRVDEHNDGIQRIKDLAVFAETPTAAFVAQIIEDLELVALDESWQEFLADAAQAKDKSLASLRALHAERSKYEAEQAEQIRLRAEAEAQAQRDREAEIARVAAENARIEAEQRAQAEREAVIQREADAKAAADRRELELKLAAEQSERAAAQAARDKIESEQRAAQQKIDDDARHQQAMAQAEADRIAAEQRAVQEKADSERRQKEAAERARLAEVARQEAADAELKRQAALREADVANKTKILTAAKESIMLAGITEEQAKAVINLIRKGEVPNVAISY